MPLYTRRQILATLAGAAGVAGSPQSPPPNILFMMADDHAAHAISAYGSKINKTPHIDRLAKEGMLFRNCFCTNSLCGPSRAVILTGKHSHLNGFRQNGDRFASTQQTFPKLLQKSGYQTAVIGKWHLETDPTGFDYWNILIGQGPYYNPPMIDNGRRTPQTGYTTEIITDLALDEHEWLGVVGGVVEGVEGGGEAVAGAGGVGVAGECQGGSSRSNASTS